MVACNYKRFAAFLRHYTPIRARWSRPRPRFVAALSRLPPLAAAAVLAAALSPAPAAADVVRPALVEISVDTRGVYRVEIRASIEALLTGINAQYQNTQDSPMAEAYDALRVMQAATLAREWARFKDAFAGRIELRFDGERAALTVAETKIPPPGYTKVPRISVITLRGTAPRSAETLDWYYPAAFGDHAVRVRQVDEARQQWHWSPWQWIRNDSRSAPFSLTEVFTQRPWHKTVWVYLIAGFYHIVPLGLDHILFVLGVFLFSAKWRPLLWQVTMFTVAHTITLGLAMAGYIRLPANIVEPLIALSIAYIGIENIRRKRLSNSRLLLVFAFGLLHGMGFAEALRQFGMPREAFFTALVSFNIGVELGQLAVIAVAFAVVGVWGRGRPWYRPCVVLPGSAAIALAGLYWTYARIEF